MKLFYYNVLLSKEDLADRVNDISFLKKAANHHKKIAIYAPRRYGKSSIARNILPNEIKTKNFIAVYCDFMGVQSTKDVANRLSKGISEGMEQYLPAKNLIKAATQLLKSLNFTFDPNPITGEATFGLSTKRGQEPTLSDLLKVLLELASTYKCFFVFDEFQDVLEAEDSLGLLRSDLQKLKNTPIFFLGSKRRLLSQIFNSHQSPFFNFADEYVLKAIPFLDWKSYFDERLRPVKIKLTDTALEQILEIALNVPNSICEIGSFIQEHQRNLTIDSPQILKIIDDLLTAKSESFYFQLKQLSATEKKVMHALAINKLTVEIQSKDFQNKTNLSLSGIKKTILRLYNSGIVEEDDHAYRISNPLFRVFILRNGI